MIVRFFAVFPRRKLRLSGEFQIGGGKKRLCRSHLCLESQIDTGNCYESIFFLTLETWVTGEVFGEFLLAFCSSTTIGVRGVALFLLSQS